MPQTNFTGRKRGGARQAKSEPTVESTTPEPVPEPTPEPTPAPQPAPAPEPEVASEDETGQSSAAIQQPDSAPVEAVLEGTAPEVLAWVGLTYELNEIINK
jgi:outer membrane biosynthesis protein TonB